MDKRFLNSNWHCLNNIAKIWAIRCGLKMALELGYKHINLEIDSQILLNWLIYGVLVLEPFVLILGCRMLLDQEWIVLSCHVFCEANDMTDELVKRDGSTNVVSENIMNVQILFM